MKIESKGQLVVEIKKADKREYNDDHLNDEERKVIVDAYKKYYPDVELPEDLTEAFLEAIGW